MGGEGGVEGATLFYTTLLPFFVYGVIQCSNPPPPRGVEDRE